MRVKPSDNQRLAPFTLMPNSMTSTRRTSPNRYMGHASCMSRCGGMRATTNMSVNAAVILKNCDGMRSWPDQVAEKTVSNPTSMSKPVILSNGTSTCSIHGCNMPRQLIERLMVFSLLATHLLRPAYGQTGLMVR